MLIITGSDRYGEFIAVPEIKYLVKIPDSMSLSVAAMLPSGALWAMNTVFRAREQVAQVMKQKGETGMYR